MRLASALGATLSLVSITTSCTPETSEPAPSQNSLELSLEGTLSMTMAADLAALPNSDIVVVSNWRQGQVSIVDVSDSTEPSLVSVIDDIPDTTDVQIKGNTLYLNGEDFGDDGPTGFGIRVYDLSAPENPQLVSLVGSGAGDVAVSSCHNLWPQPDRALLFCASTFSGQVVILSEGEGGVGSLSEPRFIGALDPPDDGSEGVHDMFARGNRLYVAWLSGGFAIYDTTDASSPQLLGGAESDGAFTHSVWPSEDGKFVFVTDEVRGGYLTIWDVSDPTNIRKVSEYKGSPDAIVHNAEVVGDIAYVSYYTDGLKVLDVSDPTQPKLIGSYDIFDGPDFEETEVFPGQSGMKGAWGIEPDFPRVYVSGTESGLWIFELKENSQ